MKISAYHKSIGDSVERYDPNSSGHMDMVYVSKVFSFTNDYPYHIDADEIKYGGTGYAIHIENKKEVFDRSKNFNLPYEIEHIYPDYDLYGIKNKAYGFLTRGCPRGCFFCHVASKEGRKSVKVADLSEFWRGQKNIELMDPNILACKERYELLEQLIDSKAKVEFNQGLDIRLMNDDSIELLNRIKLVNPHFAWDRYEDKEKIVPMFEQCASKIKVKPRQISVYVLTNYDTTHEQDLERVEILKQIGYSPYIMRYDKKHIKRGSIVNKLARYCDNRYFLWKYDTFQDYLEHEEETR